MAARWLESTLQFAAEMDADLPGYELVAGRLADVLFVQALRTYVAAVIEQASGRTLPDG